MKNMDKELITKMGADKSQIPQNLSAQIVCPIPQVWDFDEKSFIGRQ